MASNVVDIEQGIPHRSSDVESSCSSESCLPEEVEGDDDDDDDDVGSVVVGPPNDRGRRRSTSCCSSSSSTSSCVSEECSVQEVVDLENGVVTDTNNNKNNDKLTLHSLKVERDCRICHLSLDGSNPESGLPIELGCSCKDDLAAAHKQCAEAWFKIRGNKACEICGSTARNVVGVNEVELMEQLNEANENAATAAPPTHPAETRHFWQGHRFLNFLLACMVFAFVISWLFHFNVPS